jgi:hypothetical protein
VYKLRFEIGTYKTECYHVVMVFGLDSFISITTNILVNFAALLIHICGVLQTHYPDWGLEWYSFPPDKFQIVHQARPWPILPHIFQFIIH